jgi:hypothetical protein
VKDMAQHLSEQLAAQRERRKEASKALWSMSPEERERAMWKGELTGAQLYEWAKRAPHEVPLIDGEFAFIAAKTPEVAQTTDSEREKDA